jgi:hypothetical protein
MKYSVVVLIFVLLSPLQGSAQERGPIPETPLTPEEIEEAVREIRAFLVEEGELSAEEIEEEMEFYNGDLELGPTYRDEDLRSFFPEIDATDQQAYSCFIQLTYPRSYTFAYLSDADNAKHLVRLKTLDCGLDSRGLFCELDESVALFHNSPKEFFFIDESIDEAEARSVISMYHAKRGELGDLDSISKRDGDYVLGFGRRGCACWGESTARVRGVLFWKWLEVSDEVQMICI